MTRIALFGAAIAALAAASVSAQPAAPAAPAAPAQGPITRAQMQAGLQQRFTQMDVNHDGSVTAEEMVGAGGDTQRAAAMMQRMDTNHDGKLSLAELTASRLAAFDAADANHDGILTPEERAAAMARMQPPATATPH